MQCQRCGTLLADNAALCPTCGTITSTAWPAGQQPTNYGEYRPQGYDGPSQQVPYGQGYGPQPGYYTPPPQPNPGYSYGAHYQPGPINVTLVNNPVSPARDNGPMIVEILLSLLLGVYGAGWLMAGETTVGAILLVCSFFVYWPIMILGTLFTLGIGLICLIPMAIAAVIVNAILLNNVLNRKAAQVMVQAQAMPPRYPQ